MDYIEYNTKLKEKWGPLQQYVFGSSFTEEARIRFESTVYAGLEVLAGNGLLPKHLMPWNVGGHLDEIVDAITRFYDKSRHYIVKWEDDSLHIAKVLSPQGLPTGSKKHIAHLESIFGMPATLYTYCGAVLCDGVIEHDPDTRRVRTDTAELKRINFGQKCWKYLKNGEEDSLDGFIYTVRHWGGLDKQIDDLLIAIGKGNLPEGYTTRPYVTNCGACSDEPPKLASLDILNADGSVWVQVHCAHVDPSTMTATIDL